MKKCGENKMKERIFELQLDVKNPDTPFAVTRSIGTSSGDLVQVFATFQLQLVQLLRELHEEDIRDKIYEKDNIPF